MRLKLVVVADEDMIEGHDWIRYKFDDGLLLTVMCESFLEGQRAFECHEGIPLSA